MTSALENLILKGERAPDAKAQDAADALRGRRYQRALENLSRGLIIDCDDTLNKNNDLFLQSRHELVKIYSRLCNQGRSIEELALLQQQASNGLVPTLGFTPKRWFVASEMAGEEIAGRELTDEEKKEIHDAAEIALGIGELHTGVGETLEELHRHGVPIVLLTKGEIAKQQQKIDGHRLDELFGGRVVIVERKNAEVVKEVAERFSLERPVMIGDSEASDIAPALEAGLDAIHIDRGNLAWKLEQPGSLEHSAKAGSFPEAIKLLLDAELDGGF
jgi:phosphoglycolate phosphatase-like HAD superfamily hydrolase